MEETTPIVPVEEVVVETPVEVAPEVIVEAPEAIVDVSTTPEVSEATI
jgi:hypothetical protein